MCDYCLECGEFLTQCQDAKDNRPSYESKYCLEGNAILCEPCRNKSKKRTLIERIVHRSKNLDTLDKLMIASYPPFLLAFYILFSYRNEIGYWLAVGLFALSFLIFSIATVGVWTGRLVKYTETEEEA